MTKQSVYTERHGNATRGGAETLAEGRRPPARLPAVHAAPGGPGSPAAHHIQGAQLPFPPQRARLPCRPPHPGGPAPLPPHLVPGGPGPLPSGRRGPTGLPVPLQGLLPPCSGGRGVTRPGLCRSSCPFPALFPRLPLLRMPASHPRMGPPPGSPLGTFTHGEQPRASPRGRPPGVSSHRRPSHDATLRWR